MRKNFGAKACLYPMPVFIVATYNDDGTPNAMNAAWGGISCDTEVILCLAEDHRTTQNILRDKDFTLSMATVDQLEGCDYVGLVSGRKIPDKFARAGFTVGEAENVNAPLINELPLALECRMTSYDPETCHLFADIINICADESIVSEDGKIDAAKLRPITYDSFTHEYRVVGEVVGKAFVDGKNLM